MNWEIREGDVLDRLREMPDESVHCVVCSPPYWGLRDYGTASWDGGDPGCDHVAHRKPPTVGSSSTLGFPADGGSRRISDDNTYHEAYTAQYRDVCGKCGARRIDRQIGLEPTPGAYLARMVEVFREVRRVLRSDGCCFINMGDGFSSTVSPQRLKMREDASTEDIAHVAMDMLGVRMHRPEEAGPGDVPSLLRAGVAGGSLQDRPRVAGEGVEGSLLREQGTIPSASAGEESTTEVGRDRQAGWDLCLLRRDDTGVPDGRSHQREWSGASASGSREDAEQFGDGLQGHPATGIPDRRVSGSLFQLQLRERVLGILSSQTFATEDVPAHLRRYFREVGGLKPKDLIGMPWRLAFALQDDGWWLRSEIIWAKPNPMPESVTDRPTKAHEQIFLLTKSARYWYDADAIRETQTGYTGAAGTGASPKTLKTPAEVRSSAAGRMRGHVEIEGGRNARSVWTIATQPFSEAHFATFPEELPRRCIKAGTSERGVCPECGAPWKRVVERMVVWPERRGGLGMNRDRNDGGMAVNAERTTTTLGWEPTCTHGGEPVPAVVLDPFAGSGTTIMVALQLGRSGIGIELNPEYAAMARRRIVNDAPLFNSMAAAGG